MKHPLYILTLLFLSACASKSKTDCIDYAFLRDDKIYYHILKHDSLYQIDHADMPSVSPDGLKLAYRLNHDSTSSIRVLDLTTNSTYEVNTPYSHNHSPTWNANGSCLAFTSVTDRNIVINFLDINGQRNSFEPPEDCITAAWACDNQSVILNTLDSLWFIDKSGVVKKSYNIQTIVKDKWVISPSIFVSSDNDKYLYFTAHNKESQCVTPADGPFAIYRYDFNLDTVVKITDNNIDCRDFTVQGSTLFISAGKDCEKSQTTIYKFHNNTFTAVIKNGHAISTAKQNSL